MRQCLLVKVALYFSSSAQKQVKCHLYKGRRIRVEIAKPAAQDLKAQKEKAGEKKDISI